MFVAALLKHPSTPSSAHFSLFFRVAIFSSQLSLLFYGSLAADLKCCWMLMKHSRPDCPGLWGVGQGGCWGFRGGRWVLICRPGSDTGLACGMNLDVRSHPVRRLTRLCSVCKVVSGKKSRTKWICLQPFEPSLPSNALRVVQTSARRGALWSTDTHRLTVDSHSGIAVVCSQVEKVAVEKNLSPTSGRMIEPHSPPLSDTGNHQMEKFNSTSSSSSSSLQLRIL